MFIIVRDTIGLSLEKMWLRMDYFLCVHMELRQNITMLSDGNMELSKVLYCVFAVFVEKCYNCNMFQNSKSPMQFDKIDAYTW